MRKALPWAAVVGLGAVLLGGGLWALSSQLLYPFHDDERWTQPTHASCDEWLNTVAYADLQGGGVVGTRALEQRCDEARMLPGLDVVTREGIHVRVYDSPVLAQANAPILLHVHGASGNLLHGARYFPLATRLQMVLAVMELSNHGLSHQDGRGVSYGCREHADVTSVLMALQQRYPERPVLVHATSMGGMASVISLAVSPQPNVRALVLESPISSIAALIADGPEVPWVPAPVRYAVLRVASLRAGCDLERGTPASVLAQVKVVTLVEHSRQDNLVPDAMAQAVADGLTGAPWKRLVMHDKGAHSAIWNGAPWEYEAEVRDLWQHAVAAPDTP